MYYDSKSDFYIRQYGPKIGIAVLSITLIISGVYIYCSSLNSSKPNEVISAENKVEENIPTIENDSLQNIEANQEELDKVDIEISRGLTATLKNLKVLGKTDLCKVESITDNNSIVVFLGSRYYEINLIGIDYSRSSADINAKMKKDLEGKQVKLAFDKLRVKGGQVYGYVYLDEDISYNETLLKNGLAIVKIEKTNTSLLAKLVEAQKIAKTNKAGIWAN